MELWKKYSAEMDADAISFAILHAGESPETLQDLCEVVVDDFAQNEEPYLDMLTFCIDRVACKGHTPNPSHGSCAPEIRPFTETLVHNAHKLLETPGWGFDSHDIIEVFADLADHYLDWCKEIITEYWTEAETLEFLGLMHECLSKRQVPLLVPSGGSVEVVIYPPPRGEGTAS